MRNMEQRGGEQRGLSLFPFNRLFVLAGLLALLVGPTFASAQQARRIPNWKQSHLAQGDPAVQGLYILAVCVRLARNEAALALLQSRPGSPEERDALAKVLPREEDPCLLRVRKLRLPNSLLLRGAIAEAFYNGARTKPRAGTPLPAGTNIMGMEAGSQVERAAAACAVMRSPRLAHTVLQHKPGSNGEYRALLSLDDTLLGCVPEGRTLDASRLGFRALLAEALYHASRAAQGSFENA